MGIYGYIASHNWGRTIVLSDGRVFNNWMNSGWYLSEVDVNIEDYALAATEEWGADWTEIGEETIFTEYLDRDYPYRLS